jgi:hypothetical protein
MSESEIIRRLISNGLEASSLSSLISEQARIQLKRDEFMAGDGQINNLRNGFRAKVAEQFKSRFESGWNAKELRGFAENMREDARILWPQWSETDYSTERTEALQYVEAVVSQAENAVETSTQSPLDPDELFDGYAGVEDGNERQAVERSRDSEVFDRLLAEATTRMAKISSPDENGMAKGLAAEFNVELSLAEAAVSEAKQTVPPAGGNP